MQIIAASAAAQRVVAAAAVNPIIVRAAIQRVVATIAVDRIVAAQTVQGVGRGITQQGIGARRAFLHQGFNPRHIPTGAVGKLDGVERVARGAILDKVMVDGDYLVRALAGVLDRQGQMIAQTPGLNIARGNATRKTQNIPPIGAGIVVGHVGSAVAAPEQVGVVAGIALQIIAAGPAAQCVITAAAVEIVIARAAVQGVVATAAVEVIITRAAVQGIVATAAVNPIIVRAAVQRVVAAITTQRIVTAQAVQGVGRGITQQGIGARRARLHQGFNAGRIPACAVGKLDGV